MSVCVPSYTSPYVPSSLRLYIHHDAAFMSAAACMRANELSCNTNHSFITSIFHKVCQQLVGCTEKKISTCKGHYAQSSGPSLGVKKADSSRFVVKGKDGTFFFH